MKREFLVVLLFLMSFDFARAGVYSGSFGPSGTYIGAGAADTVVSDTIVGSGGVGPEALTLQSYTLTITFNNLIDVTLPDLLTYIDGALSLASYPGGTPAQSFHLDDFTPSTDHTTWTATYSPGTIGSVNPNYQWTLDLNYTGDNLGPIYNVLSWELDITAVPEPVNVALGIFAGLFVVVGCGRTEWARARMQRGWFGVNQWLDAV
jgi:hypothetical protein